MNEIVVISLCQKLKTLTPHSDWHLISPYIITPESYINVTRKKGRITN